MPEPVEAKAALQPPLSHCRARAMPILKTFIRDLVTIWKPAAERLASLMTVL